jgi:glycosyltransferase 2 family protein
VNVLPRSPVLRLTLVAVATAGALALVWWRGPAWSDVSRAFALVTWRWVLVAIGLNLASVVARSLAWSTVIAQAVPPPRPGYRTVFSAFCIGLLGNAVLPGRIGEVARVAVLTRHMPPRRGMWATLIGTVFAHRVFDLVPVLTLVVFVLVAADIPRWATTSLAIVLVLGLALIAIAMIGARRPGGSPLDGVGKARRLLTMAREGLGVMRSPLAAAQAIALQFVGWGCQLLAVWATMYAFHIHEPLAAAGLVLVLMNVATVFPLWPGNVGLLQAAVALPLVRYGVGYARGFAFAIGLQAIEASVGVVLGLVFLAREGLSFAMLREMESPAEELEDASARSADEPERGLVGSGRC